MALEPARIREMYISLLRVSRETVDGCWTRHGSVRGYVNVHRRSPEVSIHAHRLAYLFAYGLIPPVVMHRCDNPQCFRPEHLVGGTQTDNMLDMTIKGRRAKDRRWVTRDGKNRRVRASEVVAMLAAGWRLGYDR